MSYQGNEKNHYNGSSNDSAYGTNSQGNRYRPLGPSEASGGAYYYANKDGGYYYQNPNGSTYYNNGQGHSNFTPASQNPRTKE